MQPSWFPVYNKTFVVLGLARTGLAAARWLSHHGARVFGWDDSGDRRAMIKQEGILPLDLNKVNWSEITAVIQSPGVPLHFPKPHPVTQAAQHHGTPILSDCDMLRSAVPQAQFIGVTGTNGKSTTTALITHLLRQAGRHVECGGNIGTPALSLPMLTGGGVYVLELSSFQLDLSPGLALDMAVWLNMEADHLDRHGSFQAYSAAKQKLFDPRPFRGKVVMGIDDPASLAIYEGIYKESSSRIIPVSLQAPLTEGIYVQQGILVDARQGETMPVMDLTKLVHLPGTHNHQNMAVAYGVTTAMEILPEQIKQGLETFQGLPHRQQLIRILKNIRFINDSKATNLTSTAKALAAFDRIYWIAGGRPKNADLTHLNPYLNKIRHAFLIGEAQRPFAAALREKGVSYTLSGDLETALHRAYQQALKEDLPSSVILFSPACASFDQFRDFEHRGEVFQHLVYYLTSYEKE